MARTYTISGSLITISGDPFEEGKDDFIELDAIDEDGVAIVDGAVVSIAATLRSLDTGAILNGRDDQDVFNANDGTLTSGTFTLDLGGATDLAATGTRTLQRRELTLILTHSTDKVVPFVVRFLLRTYADVG